LTVCPDSVYFLPSGAPQTGQNVKFKGTKMKASLKKPVLMSAAIALFSGGFVLTGPVHAQNAPTTFEECAGVPDDIERLACYDEVATAKVPDTVAAMQKAKEEQQVKMFGLITPGPGQVLDELDITFVSIRKNGVGKLVLTTEDGQVWKQTDTTKVFYPSTVSGTIRKGMMGAYYFRPDTKQPPIKVERVE